MTNPTDKKVINEPKTAEQFVMEAFNSPYQLLALENACLLYAQQEGRKLVEALSKPCTCYHAGYLSSHQYMCPQLKALASWKARNQ